MKYIEVEFFLDTLDMYSEILQSDLCDIGFESFQDTYQGFLAYCPEGLFSKDEMNSLIVRFIENNPDVNISTKIKEIEQQNWNQEWEKTNSPVLVDEYCYIYPYFYEPLKDIEYNIEISPKMSFGSAHHPTTFQIIQLLKSENLKGKDIMDMGTGTGVLAILSKLKGASYVEAIDNDQWAYENAKENIEKNNVDVIIKLGGANLLDRNYDVFIANINLNILMDNMGEYCSHINKNGVLFLSGFLTEDINTLLEEIGKYGHFTLDKQIVKDNWVALRLTKNE
jgi:ribosomal protein L11 methyltransferase